MMVGDCLTEADIRLFVTLVQFEAKNQNKREELISYLKKHHSQIINHNRRRLAGKAIGSGRMEKGVDLTVGRRQKKKAMSLEIER